MLKEAVREAPKAVHDNMEVVAVAAVGEAKQNIPKDEGRAQGSVTYRDESRGDKVKFIVGSGIDDPPYPAYLEFGTRRGLTVGTPEKPRRTWPAKTARGGFPWEIMPWLQPALLKVRGLMKRVLRAAYGKAFGFKVGGVR
jgi:hypothetical protein